MDCFTKLGSLCKSDFGKGLIVAVVSAPLTILYQSLTATPVTLVFDWRAILGAALAGGVGYLLKNLGTGTNGKLLTNK